jgi:hypothetical protein
MRYKETRRAIRFLRVSFCALGSMSNPFKSTPAWNEKMLLFGGTFRV